MRTVLLAIVLALAAVGQARAERRDCEVVFVRAPAEVRHVIETWLEQEPRCSGTIELRVVETESGSLYLIGQRPDGRIHEREVPDAQSAGVLVASWVADDWTGTPPEDEAVPPPTPEPVTVNPFSLPPGETDVVTASSQHRSAGRWITAMSVMNGYSIGGRLEVDLFGGRSSPWTYGVSLQGATRYFGSATQTVGEYTRLDSLEGTDLRVLATATRTWRFGGRWNLRWSVGVGPNYTWFTFSSVGNTEVPLPGEFMPPTDGMSLAIESGLTIARELGDHWAIAAGPVLTYLSAPMSDEGLGRDDAEAVFVVGGRYRL